MAEALYILERAIIHFFSAYGLVSGTFFFLQWLRKKPQVRAWLPQSYLALFVISGLVVCLFAFVREPFDIHSGQWWGKAYFDYASWVLGSVMGVWGQYRMFFLVKQWGS